MEIGVRLWWCCLFFSFAFVCFAGNSISFQGEKMAVVVDAAEGRSLRVEVDDYGEASANHGHDPRAKGGAGFSDGGRRNRDIP